MNHDYCHCLDYDKTVCPAGCFRVQLSEDLRNRPELWTIPLTWAKLRQDKSICPLKEGENNSKT